MEGNWQRQDVELEQAWQLMQAEVGPVREICMRPIEEALGCILARDLFAPLDLPPFDRSALDGYALRSADTAGAAAERPAVLRVVRRVCAGEEAGPALKAGQAVRIMTGAPLAAGADCVVRQEAVHAKAGRVFLTAPLRAGKNCCFAGEDAAKGSLLLAAGSRLDSGRLGILASAGLGRVPVWSKPRTALFSTGSELCAPGAPRSGAQIYDANLTLLRARLTELGQPPLCARRLRDDEEKAAQALCAAVDEGAQLIVTTGGVSVGERDIFHRVLPLLGARQIFWRVRLRPGTPAMFAVWRGAALLHLSGNPFAALATFELLARPLLADLSGDERLRPRFVEGTLAESFAKTGPRRFVRGVLRPDGQVLLPAAKRHSSGMLTSLAGCNCLAELPACAQPCPAGMRVRVLPLEIL